MVKYRLRLTFNKYFGYMYYNNQRNWKKNIVKWYSERFQRFMNHKNWIEIHIKKNWMISKKMIIFLSNFVYKISYEKMIWKKKSIFSLFSLENCLWDDNYAEIIWVFLMI